jgi:hypothetical protein
VVGNQSRTGRGAAAELPHNVRPTPKETLTAKGVFHLHFELIDNFLVAQAAYDAAVKYNPLERWLLRDGIRVIRRYELQSLESGC